MSGSFCIIWMSGVDTAADGNIQRDTAQHFHIFIFHDPISFATMEDLCFLATVGADPVAHIFNNPQDWHTRVLKQSNRASGEARVRHDRIFFANQETN